MLRVCLHESKEMNTYITAFLLLCGPANDVCLKHQRCYVHKYDITENVSGKTSVRAH